MWQGKEPEAPTVILQMAVGRLGRCGYNVHSQNKRTMAFSWDLALWHFMQLKNILYVTLTQDGEIILALF